MPWGQVVSWYPSWRHELVNDRCPMNSAGTAGPIRTRDVSFDAPERRNDDGGGHVVLRATWHVPRAAAWTLWKMLCQDCSPNGKWPGAQAFRSEAPWSELCVNGRISPDGSKLCPQGEFYFCFSLLPSSLDTLEPRDPKIGTRVHVSKGYPNIHNLGGSKIRGSKFWIWGIFWKILYFSFFLHNSSKNVKNDIFWKLEILTPVFFFTPLTYTYSESPCCIVPLYQISWNFVKGCRS